jgi:WD40 repeat protein
VDAVGPGAGRRFHDLHSGSGFDDYAYKLQDVSARWRYSGGDTGSLALSADGKTLFTAKGGSISARGHVLVIDRATGKTLHTYQTLYAIWGTLAVSPNGSQIYVPTCSSSGDDVTCQDGYVEVLDAASGAELATISMAGDQVSQIVIPNSVTAYVAHYYNPMPCYGCDVSRHAANQVNTVPSNALTAIDMATLQVGASYSPPNYEPTSLVISPDGNTGYLLASEVFWYSGAIYEIDLASMTLTATLSTGSFCGFGSVGLSPNGATLAVASNCQYYNGLIFIDTATARVTQTVENISGGVIAVDLESNAYVLSGGENIQVVNDATGSITTMVAGRGISAAILMPAEAELYVLSAPASAVQVHEEGSPAVSQLLSIGGPPFWLALSPDGGILYSVGVVGGLFAISTTTGQVTAKMLGTTNFMFSVAVSPDGQTLYAGAYNPNILFILNASTGDVENSIALPACTSGYQGAIVVAPAGDRIYVLCGSLTTIDAATQTIVGEIPGMNGTALAIGPKGNVVYASSNPIDIVNTATNTIVGTIPIAASAIALSPDGAQAYVLSAQNNISGLAVVDTSTLAVTSFIPGISGFGGCDYNGSCAGSGEEIGITSDGKFVYAGGAPGYVIDTRSLATVGQFQAAGPFVIH